MFPLQPEVTPAGTAWISADVLESLQRDAQSFEPRETGGVLMGYWSKSPHSPVITQAIGAGPKALHEPMRFVPDHEFQEREVARAYRESDAKVSYLGDWHSHPKCAGYLSESDFKTLRRIARSRTARAPQPLMLILAFGPIWDAVVWSARHSPGLIRCKYIVERWQLSTFSSVRAVGQID